MNAVQALRHRLGFGLRLMKAVGGDAGVSLVNASAVPRVAAGLSSYVGSSRPRAETLLRRLVQQHGRAGSALEIGRRGVSHADWMDSNVRHDQRDVAVEGIPVDIVTALREIPDESYDVVFSVDTIEHVKAPWRVAAEIARILRPGGITFHSTVFTTRYQPQPEDFFRFTPDGLKSLFDTLECLTAEFDATERRREHGRKARGECADIFGGSREGWRVHYAGRRPLLR
ncbi:methyltransferase domain-containing protein [Chthonobacter albigriseus]|uniref:methyltransferase domain-containing protein n=1 Tax=Chthonobacter albigriseus TaxID=1683161 RepID=UPI0015EFBB4F|nr:methyltransferase domain-containing protein [Chthonobacter albigriseus]